jgi:hypothetical protein
MTDDDVLSNRCACGDDDAEGVRKEGCFWQWSSEITIQIGRIQPIKARNSVS